MLGNIKIKRLFAPKTEELSTESTSEEIAKELTSLKEEATRLQHIERESLELSNRARKAKALCKECSEILSKYNKELSKGEKSDYKKSVKLFTSYTNKEKEKIKYCRFDYTEKANLLLQFLAPPSQE